MWAAATAPNSRDICGHGVLRGVQIERNREQLDNTQTTLVGRIVAEKHPIARVVVPAAAGSSPVAYPFGLLTLMFVLPVNFVGSYAGSRSRSLATSRKPRLRAKSEPLPPPDLRACGPRVLRPHGARLGAHLIGANAAAR